VKFAGGPFWNSTLRPCQWWPASRRSLSWHERNPRTISCLMGLSMLYVRWHVNSGIYCTVARTPGVTCLKI
jgi:hypothetical protein